MKRLLIPLVASASLFGVSHVFAGLKVGAAVSNITPPLGTMIVGNFTQAPAAYVHDELHARAIVIDDGKQKVALVVADNIGLRGDVSANAIKRITEVTGIPEKNILISATHTHSAGASTAGRMANLAKGHPSYPEFLSEKIADAVINADQLRRDAEYAYGEFRAPEFVKNRRWIMKEGTAISPFGDVDIAKMNPPAQSPNLVKPAGPVNDRFSFLAFREPNGAMIALYGNYSLHYVGGVVNNHISSDYFGVYCEEIARRLAPNDSFDKKPFVAALSNGTFGDQNKNDYSKAIPKTQPYEDVHRFANTLVDRTIHSLKDVKWTAEAPLKTSFQRVDLHLKTPSPELKAKAKKILETTEEKKGKVDLSIIYSKRVLASDEKNTEVKAPVQLVKIGETLIGTMPGEIFVETGLEFVEKTGNKQSFLVGIAHEAHGYLPPLRQIELGGYETWFGTNRLENGAVEKMLEALLKAEKELK